MKNILSIILIILVLLVSGCNKQFKTQYFGVQDKAIFTPSEFGQTVEAIEKAKKDARSDYQYQKIKEAMEQGRAASETYWECNDEEAKAILAMARQSAMAAEMYHPQPPPPRNARALATVDPPIPPESLSPDPPFAGVKTSSPEMVLDTVQFPYDSASLTLLVPDRIDPHIKGMSNKADYEISGHADSTGDPVYNQRLSEQRAAALKRYLKKQGLPARKLYPVGYGEGLPAVSNDTEDGRSQNRRAEIRVQSPVFSAPSAPAYRTLPAGTTIEMVRFNFGSNQLHPDYRSALDQMAGRLKKEKRVKLEVAGYADSTGSDVANTGISKTRARIVADYLRRKGVSGKRMIVRGYGEGEPFATNETPEGRALNRRVEIKILK